MSGSHFVPVRYLGLAGALFLAGSTQRYAHDPATVAVKLSEWKVELSVASVAPGPVRFNVTNVGSVPHAFEVEGGGVERETPIIQPGATGTLELTLKAGHYEIYCPVGSDSHKKLGMNIKFEVSTRPMAQAAMHDGMGMAHEMTMEHHMAPVIHVTGGGPVVQILPGPFPFPDSAGPILKAFGGEQEALESQSENGPYSNNVAKVTGSFTIDAWELGATRDSVAGVAEFTGKDGSHWKAVIDRVQTNDVPHHPKFGGVIMGLYYHGNTGVHTPLVPTINSAVALWAYAHLYKNDQLVSDNAWVHVMLLSRTRRDGDYQLACWDCSKQKVEELQLQITAAPGEAKFESPGGFLFVNWEKSRSTQVGGTD